MGKFIYSLIILLIGVNVLAQNTKGKSDDIGRITLASYIPPQVDKLPEGAKGILQNKLDQIVTQNGMGGSYLNQRFIITANIVVMYKELTATAPSMTAITIDLTLYIGDGIDGSKFSSSNPISLKGIGTNETKAYIEAIKQIKPSDAAIQSFVDQGKTRIIEYYNTRCDFIIKEAETLANINDFDQAIFKLISVPEVCKDCYNKCLDAIGPIYKKKIDLECELKLNEAKTRWAATQNLQGANEVVEIVSSIDPASSCYKDVKELATKVEKRIKELDNREWQFMLQVHKDDKDLKSAAIEAARAIGVAYGNHQPQVVYKVVGWW